MTTSEAKTITLNRPINRILRNSGVQEKLAEGWKIAYHEAVIRGQYEPVFIRVYMERLFAYGYSVGREGTACHPDLKVHRCQIEIY